MSDAVYPIDQAFVLSEANVSTSQKTGKPVHYLPLYMSMCLGEDRDVDLASQKFILPRFDD